MKRNSYFNRPSNILLAFIFLIPLVFSACKKSSDTGGNNTSAALMAFNLITDKPSIGFAISGNNLTSAPLLYTNYTGNYLPIFIGSREVESYDFTADSSIATASGNFEANKYYSVFAVGSNGNYSNIIVNDDLDTLTSASGNAFVRYINAIPDSSKPMVTVSSNGTSAVSSNAPYATISDFTGVTPGDYTVGVNNETNISATRTITLEKDKVYTVLLTGTPQATDSARAVQIKFITNGTLTP